MNAVYLRVFNKGVRIDCSHPALVDWLCHCFSGLLEETDDKSSDLNLDVLEEHGRWIVRHTGSEFDCGDRAELIYVIEKEITVELQRQRPDLFFIHAAAVAIAGKCTILVGASGAGKSTLCWELLHEGFAYMSDELAPVDPDTLRVESYAHAICLKRERPDAHALPDDCLRTDATIHIATSSLPSDVCRLKPRLTNIVFLTGNREDATTTQLVSLNRSEAAARLYANGLNQLAHDGAGLATVARIAAAANCYRLAQSPPAEMCAYIADRLR